MKLITFVISLACAEAANILAMFPCPSQSHSILASALLKVLARRGHNVTLFSPYINENPPENFTNVKIQGAIEEYNKTVQVLTDSESSIAFKYYTIVKNLFEIMKFTMQGVEFKRLINQEPKFDLIIQQHMLNEAMLVMGYKHQAPTIAFATTGADTYTSILYNNPVPFAYVPNAFLPFTDDMSFTQRVINTVAGMAIQLAATEWNIPKQSKLLRETYPKAPTLEELMDGVDVMFVNTHVLSESARPLQPNMIQIGGFHLYDNEPLPSEIKKFLDASKEGVIYCNFGTNIKNSTLSPAIQNAIKKSLSNVEYNVLFKFDGDWVDKPKHVFISKWLPQRAILAHPSIKVFVTHGGLGGVSEGIFNGVPMLGMPFYVDQVKNVANLVQKGCGVELNPYSFTEEGFARALQELIDNPAYSRNVEALSSFYRNVQSNPLEKAVHWVEHMLKYKNAKYLKSKGFSLPWYQYMLLDVFAFIGLILVFIFFTIYCIFKYLRFVYGQVFPVAVKEKMS